jgi:hypothetical protein
MNARTQRHIMAYVDRAPQSLFPDDVDKMVRDCPQANDFVRRLKSLSASIEKAFESPMLEPPPHLLMTSIDSQIGRIAALFERLFNTTLDRQWRRWKAL